jgi:hypothetical protein
LLVEQADAQQVVPEMSAGPSLVLGDGTRGNGDGDMQLSCPTGVASIAADLDWLVITEQYGHRIKTSNIRTGALVCASSAKLGEGSMARDNLIAIARDNLIGQMEQWSNGHLR